MTSADDIKQFIGDQARALGFVGARIARAGPVACHDRFEQWLDEGCHAGMAYLSRARFVRANVDRLLADAGSVICLAASYAPRSGDGNGDGLIARFARGRDYHRVLKARCNKLMDRLRPLWPGFEARAFVDAGPIAERSLAANCGLGWIGANGCLFVPGAGSYVVLCEIVTNLPLPPDERIPSRCTRCGQCRQACPTGALREDGLVDARRCRSYLTIEHIGAIARNLWPRMSGTLFGCDDCQQACPHNQDVPPGAVELIGSPPAQVDLAAVLGWSQEDWDAFTRGRTLRRRDYLGWLRNAVLVAGAATGLRAGQAGLLKGKLGALRERPEVAGPLSSELDWALDRLGSHSAGVAKT